jgi:hypothetical protein
LKASFASRHPVMMTQEILDNIFWHWFKEQMPKSTGKQLKNPKLS